MGWYPPALHLWRWWVGTHPTLADGAGDHRDRPDGERDADRDAGWVDYTLADHVHPRERDHGDGGEHQPGGRGGGAPGGGNAVGGLSVHGGQSWKCVCNQGGRRER